MHMEYEIIKLGNQQNPLSNKMKQKLSGNSEGNAVFLTLFRTGTYCISKIVFQ